MAQTNPGMAMATQPGPRASIPRIAAGDDGRIYLTFRSGAGERSNVGTIYEQYWTWYDGAQWSRPMELAHTTGPVDLRPAIQGLGADGALLVTVTDNRKFRPGRLSEEATGGDPVEVNADLIASELHFSAPAREMKLNSVAAETPALMPKVRVWPTRANRRGPTKQPVTKPTK